MHPTTDALQVIYVAANALQAELLAGALKEKGIAAVVSNEALQIGLGGLPPGFDTAPRVLVDRARALALEFEARLRESRQSVAPAGAWHQFTIRGLLFQTACVAIYLGVDRAVALGGGQPNSRPAMAAVFLFCIGALGVAFWRKWRAERA